MNDIAELSEKAMQSIEDDVRRAVIMASKGDTDRFVGLNRVARLEMMGGVTPLQMAYRRALEKVRRERDRIGV